MFNTNDFLDADGDGNTCEGSIVLTRTATDPGSENCPTAWLKWQVVIDIWGDGTDDLEYSSFLPAFDSQFNDTNGNGIPDVYLAPTASGDMVSIPSGKFIMGCIDENGNYCKEDEKHRREVKVNSFKIGKYEVTQEEWRAVMGIDPPELKNKECDRCPVENVSWNDIQYFIEKLNQMTKKKYRLPTEAEWEFAARGGEKFRFAGSNDIDRVGWYSGNSRSDTYIVGAKVSNEYRLYDMSGNVWEWCQDIYHKSYEGAPIDGKSNELNGSNRVVRGGCSGSDAKYCRVSCRGNFSPEVYSKFIGFRLALSQ